MKLFLDFFGGDVVSAHLGDGEERADDLRGAARVEVKERSRLGQGAPDREDGRRIHDSWIGPADNFPGRGSSALG